MSNCTIPLLRSATSVVELRSTKAQVILHPFPAPPYSHPRGAFQACPTAHPWGARWGGLIQCQMLDFFQLPLVADPIMHELFVPRRFHG